WQDRRAGDGGFGLLPRIAWLAAREPEAVERARWLMTSWDALGLWLSGTAATTVQSHETPLPPAAVRKAGADPGRIPPPVRVGVGLGGLRPAVALRLGLPPGTPIVSGVNDGTASMLGAGMLDPGDAVDTGGASGGIGIYVDRPLELPGTFCAPAPIEGLWVVGGAMAATGAALDWLAGPVLGGVRIATLLDEAAAVAPGADGLVFLPYLAGERAPIFDDGARGAFVGLTLAHTRAHLARAVLEAAAFALRHVAEPVLAAGAAVREMRLAGKPARSELWARIKADATGFPVATLAVDETAVLGAAILAAHGAGLVPDLADAVRGMTHVTRRLEPEPALRAVYDARFATYRALYPALRSAAGSTVEGW
ncbi:MAG TPA: FGGY-family carbohydrate kinase, partial [Candidatus Limnocylindrales bacterium]